MGEISILNSHSRGNQASNKIANRCLPYYKTQVTPLCLIETVIIMGTSVSTYQRGEFEEGLIVSRGNDDSDESYDTDDDRKGRKR